MGSVKQNDPMGYHYPRCRKYLRRITQEVIEMVENPPPDHGGFWRKPRIIPKPINNL